MSASLFLQPCATERLRRTAQRVRSRAGVEIVVDIDGDSDRSYWVRTIFAPALLLFLFIRLGNVALVLPWLLLFVALLVALVPSVRRRLLGARRLEARARRKAIARFAELGMHSARRRTSLLLYVALAEQRCVLVPDVGVRARAPEPIWSLMAGRVERTILRHGVGAVGLSELCRALRLLGDVLERSGAYGRPSRCEGGPYHPRHRPQTARTTSARHSS